jgi:hypothetical protein
MNYTLSLLISGIRNENWPKLYEQMKKSCDRHSFEIVFCSPYELPEELRNIENIQYINDFGSPSRCVQRASTIAKGKFIAIASDDGIIHESTFSNAIDLLVNSDDPYKNIVALRYTEGQNFVANPEDFAPKYWLAKYHGDLRLDGIDNNWNICLMFLMNTERFKEIGGLDCRFEHYNCNLHDLAFRTQRDNGKILISEEFIMAHDWEPHRNVNNSPILQAFFFNDKPLFDSIYSSTVSASDRPIKIDYDNWKIQPSKWNRRFN